MKIRKIQQLLQLHNSTRSLKLDPLGKGKIFAGATGEDKVIKNNDGDYHVDLLIYHVLLPS